MENDQITNILTISLIVLVCVLFILILIYLVLWTKRKKLDKKEKKENSIDAKEKESKSAGDGRKSVEDFMNFYTVQDDMIIQKKNKKFLMVLQCQGINYDLMSELEKNSVEAGFVQFLNTLNHPIQLYVQTRKVNLTSSINTYKTKMKKTEEKLNKLKYQYEKMKKDPNADKKQLNRMLFEVTKQTNLYEYTKDIIRNTYIVVSFVPEGDETALMGEDEIVDYAFSELYTKAQSLSRVLMVCDVNSKVLNSLELSELLYVAYNREESDIFSIERAISAGYDSLYVTAPDVLDKKKRALDKIIEERAWQKANDAVTNARIKSQKQKEVEEKETNLDDLIKQMAEMIIEQNSATLTSEIKENALEEINGSEEKEEDE